MAPALDGDSAPNSLPGFHEGLERLDSPSRAVREDRSKAPSRLEIPMSSSRLADAERRNAELAQQLHESYQVMARLHRARPRQDRTGRERGLTRVPRLSRRSPTPPPRHPSRPRRSRVICAWPCKRYPWRLRRSDPAPSPRRLQWPAEAVPRGHRRPASATRCLRHPSLPERA